MALEPSMLEHIDVKTAKLKDMLMNPHTHTHTQWKPMKKNSLKTSCCQLKFEFCVVGRWMDMSTGGCVCVCVCVCVW